MRFSGGADFMKKQLCVIVAAVLMLLMMSCAMAEQTVRLPESSYRLTLPDGMEYDGPGQGSDDARFAYVSASLGLEIDFFLHDRKGAGLEEMADIMRDQGMDAAIYRISGIEMIVYRVSDPGDPPEKGMKCVGYVLTDGAHIQELCFWYANQKAADLTATIINSITDKD